MVVFAWAYDQAITPGLFNQESTLYLQPVGDICAGRLTC